ncbi:MAG: hypothetical protein KDC32_07775 [Saprospiraceae bacterium]|nr:hypothetical protein [Saprospiraceae bacterium]
MKKFLLFPLLFALVASIGCKNDDEDPTLDPEYHAHIVSPNTDAKMVGDEIHIQVDFEDHNGGTVHHINVRIYSKDDGTEIYNQPTEAHVHATEGFYTFEDDFTLNVDPHTDWILEAKVWGHEDGAHEVTESIEFHVHPM